MGERKGIIVHGTVNFKSMFPAKEGKKESYFIDVAIPGILQCIRFYLPKEKWDGYKEQSPFVSAVTFRQNGNFINWNIA